MLTPLSRTISFFSIMLLLLCSAPPASALTPDEVVVVANTHATDSVKLAKYYMKKRSIPEENLIKIKMTWEESCDRREYETRIAPPIRKAVNKLRKTKNIRCIVTMYGIPLKIRPPALGLEDEKEVKKIKQQSLLQNSFHQ